MNWSLVSVMVVQSKLRINVQTHTQPLFQERVSLQVGKEWVAILTFSNLTVSRQSCPGLISIRRGEKAVTMHMAFNPMAHHTQAATAADQAVGRIIAPASSLARFSRTFQWGCNGGMNPYCNIFFM